MIRFLKFLFYPYIGKVRIVSVGGYIHTFPYRGNTRRMINVPVPALTTTDVDLMMPPSVEATQA